MAEEFWRAVVVIEKDQSSLIDPTIRSIRLAGIDNIHLVVAPGVRVSKSYDHIAHQAARGEWEDSYSLWRGGLDLVSNVYASRSQLFLVVRPGLTLWEQLLTYCEATIPRDKVAVWSPFTPDRLFATSSPSKPDCGKPWGWCPHPVSRDMISSHCFVMTGHVMTLMANYLPPIESGANVSSMVAEHLGRRNVPFYFHTPSLAKATGHELEASDFTGVSFRMSQKVMRRKNFILESVA